MADSPMDVPVTREDRAGAQELDIIQSESLARRILGRIGISAAYAWLRVTDRFRLDVLRDGERIELRYRVNG